MPAHRRRPIPRYVAAATLAFVLLGAAYSVLSPMGEAMDEAPHADLIFHLAAGGSYGRYDDRLISVGVWSFCQQRISATRMCPTTGASNDTLRRFDTSDAPDRSTRETFAQEGGDAPGTHANQLTHHPPLYYEVMAGALRLERAVTRGRLSMDEEWAFLRLVGVLCMAPLPLIAWSAARRIGAGPQVARLSVLLPFTNPELLHIGATLGGESMLIPAAAVVMALCCSVLRGDRTRRTAMGIGVALGIALLLKAFALALVPLVACSYLLGRPAGSPWGIRTMRGVVRPLVGSIALAGALGGWWYARNLSRYGQLDPTIGERTFGHAADWHASLGTFTHRFLSDITWRFWGDFGWWTVTISQWALVLAIIVTISSAGCVAWMALEARRRRPHPAELDGSPMSLGELLVLWNPIGIIFCFVFVHAWTLYRRSSALPFIQGRYLFTGIVALWLVAGIGVERILGRRALAATAVGVTLMQGDAIRQLLAGYWGNPGADLGQQLRSLAAWSAWPPMLLVAGLALLAISVVWLTETLVADRSEADVAAIGPVPAGPNAWNPLFHSSAFRSDDD